MSFLQKVTRVTQRKAGDPARPALGPTRPSQLEVQCPPGLSLFTAVAHGRRAGNPSRSLQLMLWVTTTHRGQRMCPAMVWLSPLYRGGKGPAHVLPVTAAIHGSQKGQPLLRAPCALGLKYSSSSDTGARRGRRLAPGDPAQEQGLRAQQPGPSWHHVPWAPRPASSRGASQSPFSPDQPRSAPLPTRPSSAFCLQDKTPPSERASKRSPWSSGSPRPPARASLSACAFHAGDGASQGRQRGAGWHSVKELIEK